MIRLTACVMEREGLKMPTDPEVIRANFEADDGWRYVCRDCGKTPQDIGLCDQCGYNRPYEKVRSSKLQ